MADTWIAPDQSIDFSVTANRRKFIDASGKPADLGANGQTPTGTPPPLFLRRAPSADPSTFANNLGTGGGPFIIGGGVTTTGALVNMADTVVVADATGIAAGQYITATGVPTGTTVLSVDALSMTVTMSAAATATNPTATMQFGGVLINAPSSPSD